MWNSFKLQRQIKSYLRLFNFSAAKPVLPRSSQDKIYIHLGCGNIDIPGFINVDIKCASHIDYVCDVKNLSIFKSDWADLIYACHVLEHISHRELKKTLWEWRRVLKTGGTLRLSTPDFDKIIDIYNEFQQDIKSIIEPLMGGQESKYNIHYSILNYSYLEDALKAVGFRTVRIWDAHEVNPTIKDWSVSDIIRNGKAFPVSLNLEAVK